MVEVEAMGQLATAGLAAHNLDSPAGEEGHRHYVCRNCGAPLTAKFCAACGQAGHVHRSIGHVAHEFLHGITHLDGKAMKTLPKLALDPGGLTHDYVHGRRTRYIAPVALFLMCVFLMFFVFGFTGGVRLNEPSLTPDGAPPTARQAAAMLPELDKALADMDKGAAKARKEAGAGVGVLVDGARDRLQAERDRLAMVAAGKTPPPAAQTIVGGDEPGWATAIRRSVEKGHVTINGFNPETTQRVRRALLNPEFTLYKIQQKAYKLSFLLVPLSLPWLWLMFAWRRGHTLYDHSVFLLYSLSFMSLLLILATLLGIAGVESGWPFVLLLMVAPVVHMFMQLKGAYRLSGWSAAWRTGMLVMVAIPITLSLFATGILMLGMIE